MFMLACEAVCVIVLPVDAVVVAADVIVLRASSNAPAGRAGAVGEDCAVPHVTPAAGADVSSPFSPLDGCLIHRMSIRDRPDPGAAGTVPPTPDVPTATHPSLPHRWNPSPVAVCVTHDPM